MSIKKYISLAIAGLGLCQVTAAQTSTDYTKYHNEVVHAGEIIAAEKYAEAILIFEKLFQSYQYVFLKDYKIAAQLAMFLKDENKTLYFIRLGISDGWTMDEIVKDPFFKPLQKNPGWNSLTLQYDSLHKKYSERINQSLRAETEAMFKRDQKLDLPYYLRYGQKAKERYAIRKFAPNSERQMKRLDGILSVYGYPGEKIIGNDYWASTILAHHNSIAPDYQKTDTLYPMLRPKLLMAIQRGELAPWDFAIIEDWYVAVKSTHKQSAFGYIEKLNQEELEQSEKLRKSIGLCSITTRNKLVDIQKKTGMNLYLDGAQWVEGDIILVKNGN